MNEIVCIVTELSLGQTWGGDELVGYHKFKLPGVGQKDFYKDRMTCNAFFNSCKKGRNHTKTKLFTYRHENEPGQIDETKPMLEHKSIWDFYKTIGYDHQTKKYKA